MSAVTSEPVVVPTPLVDRAAARAPRSSRQSLVVLVAHELREHRRTPLLWGGLLGAMSAMMVAIWPSISDTLGRLSGSYPAGLRQAFGIVRLDSVEAYLDAEMFSVVVPMAIAILAIRSITGPVVVAEDRGELDTLLALPVSRRHLAWGAFMTTAVVTAATLVVVWACTVAVGTIAGTGISLTAVGRGVVSVWPLCLVFAGVAALAGGALRGAGRATGTAVAVLLAMYVVDLAGRVAPGLGALRDVSAFRYYGSAMRDGLDISHLALLAAAAILLVAAGAELLERRDLA